MGQSNHVEDKWDDREGEFGGLVYAEIDNGEEL